VFLLEETLFYTSLRSSDSLPRLAIHEVCHVCVSFCVTLIDLTEMAITVLADSQQLTRISGTGACRR